MTDGVIVIDKPLGISPLDSINMLKESAPELRAVPMTYAGRLDPMATGVLLVLVGDTRYKKEEFQNLDKVYEAEILLGFKSDTYDVLGLAENGDSKAPTDSEIKKELDALVGPCALPYPPYSSKPVNGKPLHEHAREDTLDSVEIPKQNGEVVDISNIAMKIASSKDLLKSITSRLSLVKGNFRQVSVLTRWKTLLASDKEYAVVRATIQTSSGVYIRSLAHALGRALNSGGLLYSLKRTRVGPYNLTSAKVLP